MIRSILIALALAGVSSAAQAQTAQVIPACGTASLPLGPGGRLFVDTTGTLCTVAGAGGAGGPSGSVTAAGTNGTVAQAVQGITGGIPQNSYSGQYTTALPTFTNGQSGYVALDVNGRQILAPSSVIGVQSTGTDGTTQRQIRTTTTGVLEPPTAATGKITQTSVSIAATTSTQLVAANTARIAVEIQCDGTAPVGIDRTGGTLTSATAAPLVIPTGSYPLYTMPIATQTAITAYTATAQTCRVTEYLR